jgi:hypothetical protein
VAGVELLVDGGMNAIRGEEAGSSKPLRVKLSEN